MRKPTKKLTNEERQKILNRIENHPVSHDGVINYLFELEKICEEQSDCAFYADFALLLDDMSTWLEAFMEMIQYQPIGDEAWANHPYRRIA